MSSAALNMHMCTYGGTLLAHCHFRLFDVLVKEHVQPINKIAYNLPTWTSGENGIRNSRARTMERTSELSMASGPPFNSLPTHS